MRRDAQYWQRSARGSHDLCQVELGVVQHPVDAGGVHQLYLPLQVGVLLVPPPHVERLSVLEERPEAQLPMQPVAVVVVLGAAALKVAAEPAPVSSELTPYAYVYARNGCVNPATRDVTGLLTC